MKLALWRRKPKTALARAQQAGNDISLLKPSDVSWGIAQPQYDAESSIAALRQVTNFNQQIDQLAQGMLDWLITQVKLANATEAEELQIIQAVLGRIQVAYVKRLELKREESARGARS